MAAVELGRGPKDGSNSTDTSTDVSSSDVTRTIGAFNTGEGVALSGESAQADGTLGTAHAGGKSGVVGVHTADGNGVFGHSALGDGTWGVSDGNGRSGVVGIHTGNGNAIYGRAGAPGRAGFFDGIVEVTGDIKLMGGDVAEDFQIVDAGGVEPGTVMVLEGVDRVRASDSAYDRRVVGIVAGAGEYRPGVVLGHQNTGSGRQPIALVGKTFCKVDASFAAVAMGDLLTTSPTPGHAMKATDAHRAFGAVVGKAMAPLAAGKALVAILVTLN
jgi:hypothetical protein